MMMLISIHPMWPVFIKSNTCPVNSKRTLSAQRQKTTRNNFVYSFVVLQEDWVRVKGSICMQYQSCIMTSCIHVRDNVVTNWAYEEVGSRWKVICDNLFQVFRFDFENFLADLFLLAKNKPYDNFNKISLKKFGHPQTHFSYDIFLIFSYMQYIIYECK